MRFHGRISAEMISSIVMTLLFVRAGTREVVLPSGPGPLDNPLKGFAAYSRPGEIHSCPVSMAFEEIGFDKLEPRDGAFEFGAWERDWNLPPAKGKDVVIRVFLDYPGQPSSVPSWLTDRGVRMNRYDEFGGGYSPDYEDPVLRRAMLRMIEELGKRYDRDSRVVYVQLGFLGHWGEWHTYPKTSLFASQAVQEEVIEALHKAFPDKPLMARNASYKSCQKPWIGFHDDMIPEDTLGSQGWEFLPSIIAAGCKDNWKVAPTGGEMVPGAAARYLGQDWDLLLKAVREAHFTWIGPYCPALKPDLTSQERQRTEQLIRTLGYEYRLETLAMPAQVPSGQEAGIRLTGTNQGVAPFYFPWKVRLALLDPGGHTAAQWDLADDVRRWLPGRFSVDWNGAIKVTPGRYRVGFGIVDPATDRPSVGFANALPVVGGFAVLGLLDVVKPLTTLAR